MSSATPARVYRMNFANPLCYSSPFLCHYCLACRKPGWIKHDIFSAFSALNERKVDLVTLKNKMGEKNVWTPLIYYGCIENYFQINGIREQCLCLRFLCVLNLALFVCAWKKCGVRFIIFIEEDCSWFVVW